MPDAFAKSPQSNNYKLLQLHTKTRDEMQRQLDQILESMTLEGAKLCALDDIQGGRINLDRGDWEDDAYQFWLRAKQMQNMADGTFPKLLEALMYILDVPEEQLRLQEVEGQNMVDVHVGMKAVDDAGIDFDLFPDMVRKLLSVNLHIRRFGYYGELEFINAFEEQTNDEGEKELVYVYENEGVGKMPKRGFCSTEYEEGSEDWQNSGYFGSIDFKWNVEEV